MAETMGRNKSKQIQKALFESAGFYKLAQAQREQAQGDKKNYHDAAISFLKSADIMDQVVDHVRGAYSVISGLMDQAGECFQKIGKDKDATLCLEMASSYAIKASEDNQRHQTDQLKQAHDEIVGPSARRILTTEARLISSIDAQRVMTVFDGMDEPNSGRLISAKERLAQYRPDPETGLLSVARAAIYGPVIAARRATVQAAKMAPQLA